MIYLSRMIVSAVLLSSSTFPLMANSKSLLVNGVYAAVHGDVAVDSGEWRNNKTFSALRLKAGFQLIRVGFVGVTVGYQKVGFYTAEKNWSDGNNNKTHFDYRGPIVELHLLPSEPFSFSIAANQSEGFSYLKNKTGGMASYGVNCGASVSCAAIDAERSSLQVTEFSAQANYTFHPGMQIFLGGGLRHVKGTPYYEERVSQVNSKNETIHVTVIQNYDQADWIIDSKFFMLGIRGSTL